MATVASRRREADGTMVPLAVGYDGKKLNSPNDLVFDAQGTLWFTDPPYGLPGTFKDPGKELPFQGVYRVTKDGQHHARHQGTGSAEWPGVLARLQDPVRRQLADTRAASGRRTRSKPDGTLANGRVFFDSTQFYKDGDGVPDGLKVDVHGNLFATGPGGVLVLTPDGTLLGRILTGVPTANVAFGEDGATLFVTANHRVLRLRTKTQGMPLPSRTDGHSSTIFHEGDFMTARRLVGADRTRAGSARASTRPSPRPRRPRYSSTRAAPVSGTTRFPPVSRP